MGETNIANSSAKISVYGNEYCPAVPPVRSLLRRAGVDYDYVSISLNRAARRRVMEINDGNASVPTLVFPDGSTLTEPSLAELAARLETLGYAIQPETFWDKVVAILLAPSILMFGIVFLGVGVVAEQPSMTVAGGVLLATALVGRLVEALRGR
jgi:mycoredoxin